MKQEKESGFKRLWAGFDRLLLAAVFVLLALVWYSATRMDTQTGTQTVRGNAEAVPAKKPLAAAKAIDALRVSASRTRMSSIARSMVEKDDWSGCPRSPAMDMREDGKTYEILFSLPEGVVQDSLRVTTLGDVLTLAMRSGESGKPLLKRVRLPCSVEQPEHVKIAISNNVLRVRIQSDGSL